MVRERRVRLRALLLALLAAVALAGCGGTKYATVRTPAGDDLMLLGHDPVAYFTMGKPMRGHPHLKVTLPDRTYYFLNEEHRRLFEANPAKYEPQWGGFCSNGAPFGMKLGSDPTEFEIHEGKLLVFGDIQGHAKWSLDPAFNVKYAEQMWPQIRDRGWRDATFSAWVNRVPWYRTGQSLTDEWKQKHPDKPLTYNPGGFMNNLLWKYPGWRAREGHEQPALGIVGVDPCPPACAGTESKGYETPWPRAAAGIR